MSTVPMTTLSAEGDEMVVNGAVWSILNDDVSTVTLPALSVARKSAVCEPSLETVKVFPDCHAPPSRRYSVDATPLLLSEAVAFKRTGDVYESFDPFGESGSAARETEGGSGSYFQALLPEAVLPEVEAFAV